VDGWSYVFLNSALVGGEFRKLQQEEKIVVLKFGQDIVIKDVRNTHYQRQYPNYNANRWKYK
jgi:hypothetical protein